MKSFFAKVISDALAPSIARWSTRREREILKNGKALPVDLVEFARDLGIHDPESLRLQIVSRIPLPIPDGLATRLRQFGLPVFHPAGMALGRGISAISDESGLLRHELVHVIQYQRLGGHQGFMRSYIHECLLHGYFNAPLEQEARRWA